MKEIKIEKKCYDIQWEAIDGTIFYNKEECEKYEQTAAAVLRAKFKKLVKYTGTEYSIVHMGGDEDTIYAVGVNTEEDANAIKQLFVFDNPYYIKDNECKEKNLETLNRYFDKVDKAYKEKDILFVGENYEGEIYIIDTRQDIIDRLLHITEEENK